VRFIFSKTALWTAKIQELENQILHYDSKDSREDEQEGRNKQKKISPHTSKSVSIPNHGEIEFNQAKKIPKKLQHTVQKPAEEKTTVTPTEKQSTASSDEPTESPPSLEDETQDALTSKSTTPMVAPPKLAQQKVSPVVNLAIFRGGVVSHNISLSFLCEHSIEIQPV
jgi:hypothetical protein